MAAWLFRWLTSCSFGWDVASSAFARQMTYDEFAGTLRSIEKEILQSSAATPKAALQ